jgi:hypothetical protein
MGGARRRHTFKILRRQEYASNVALFYQVVQLLCYCGAVESDHEQLPLISQYMVFNVTSRTSVLARSVKADDKRDDLPIQVLPCRAQFVEIHSATSELGLGWL